MIFSNLNEDIFLEIFMFLDDFTKLDVLIVTMGTRWNFRVQKVLKSKPLELNFGDVNMPNKKMQHFPQGRNFKLMKLMDIKFNLNFHYQDLAAKNLFKVLNYIDTENMKDKVNLLNLSSTTIWFESFYEFQGEYPEYQSLTKGTNIANTAGYYGRTLQCDVMENLTELKINRCDFNNSVKNFLFSKIERLELFICDVGFLPRSLKYLRLKNCSWRKPAIFPVTLTELILENNMIAESGKFTSGVLQLLSEPENNLKRLTFIDRDPYNDFVNRVFKLRLEDVVINAPKDYVTVLNTEIKQVGLIKHLIRGEAIKYTLKRSNKGEWTKDSQIKAKAACSNKDREKTEGFVDDTLSYINYIKQIRELLDAEYQAIQLDPRLIGR